MKKYLLAVAVTVLMAGTALALGDNNNSASATANGGNGGYVVDNSRTTNTNTAIAAGGEARATIEHGAVDNNVNTNIRNSNENNIRNTNMQGQLQGQMQGQGQVAVGKVSTDVKIEGDTTKTTALAFPSVNAAEGTSSGSATYLFGSLGKANTETYKKIIPQIQTILAIPDDILPAADKQVAVKALVAKMMAANRTQRFLGVLWEDNSKSLLNVFGLLTWDSFWNEGQAPLQSKGDIGGKKVVTTK